VWFSGRDHGEGPPVAGPWADATEQGPAGVPVRGKLDRWEDWTAVGKACPEAAGKASAIGLGPAAYGRARPAERVRKRVRATP
jgi:hypothetical protein